MDRELEVIGHGDLKIASKLVYLYLIKANKHGLTITQISEGVALNFPATSRAISELIEFGLISRLDTQIAGHRGLRPVFTIL